ncbi:MAG: hypothetical protein N2442_12840 [Spirochaetes bacterium]|nr:hypothetical protein [Spirochaetota bacterium]
MEAIEKLLSKGKYSRKDLLSIYRFLCKHTHPDIRKDGGELFLRVRQVYEEALGKLNRRSSATFAHTSDSVGPIQCLRFLDLPQEQSPRGYLFSALRLYFLLGLHSYKVRASVGKNERYTMVIQAVQYWAEQYNPRFSEEFKRFNDRAFQPISDLRKLKTYTLAKRLFVSGAELFLHYQETGREISRKLAGEKLTSALNLLERLKLDDPTESFARFLLVEIEKGRAPN